MSLISPNGPNSRSRSLRSTNLDIWVTTTSFADSLASVRSFLRAGFEMATERTRSGSSSLPSSSSEALAEVYGGRETVSMRGFASDRSSSRDDDAPARGTGRRRSAASP